MKIIIAAFTFTLCISCSLDSDSNCDYVESYYPLIYQAEIAFYKADNEKAFNLYQRAFRKCKPLNVGMFKDATKFARICALLNKTELAIEYIELCLKSGESLERFQNDSAFKNLWKTVNGKILIEQYPNMRLTYLNSINIDLREELQKMIFLDQKFNSTANQDSIFKINELKLVQIFEKFEYPTEKLIGGYNIDGIDSSPLILLLHTSDSIRLSYFLPKLQTYVSLGKCPPYVLGSVIDNLHLFNNTAQTHGTYSGKTSKYAKMIDDIALVDKNRIEIGLPTLKVQRQLDSLKRLWRPY